MTDLSTNKAMYRTLLSVATCIKRSCSWSPWVQNQWFSLQHQDTREMLISTFFLNSWSDVSNSAWIQPRSGTSRSVFRALLLTRYPHPSSQCPIHHLYTWRILGYRSVSHQCSWPFYSHTGPAHWWGNDAGQERWAGLILLFLLISLKQLLRIIENDFMDQSFTQKQSCW